MRGTTTDDTIVISMMNTSHQRRRLEVGMIMYGHDTMSLGSDRSRLRLALPISRMPRIIEERLRSFCTRSA